jgi:hypothetical protein
MVRSRFAVDDRSVGVSLQRPGWFGCHLVREVLYKSLGKTLRSKCGVANLFGGKLIYKNQLFIEKISNCETRFSIPQQRSLCRAARFFTRQKIFPHCEIRGETKKNRRKGVGFSLNVR